ncbi:YczE/YyaS/YitT family protein [Duncaniella muris]|uniref:YczE/YyaS/YitT family protein n=1 Tax=Duncaniella muris TaxID=2094150 RepID=UPI003F5D48D5
MRNWIIRYAVFIIGLYFLTLGVVLIIRSSLGTSPISSFSYVLSLNTPLTLGMATFILNMLLIAGQFWFLRGIGTRRDYMEIMMQIPFSLLFSAFLDINMYLFRDMTPESYAGALAFLAVGCLIQAFGVVLEIKPNVVAMSGEGFVKYAARRFGKDFGRVKVMVDVGLVLLAVVTSLAMTHSIIGVREGTLVAALGVGLLVSFINTRLISHIPVHRILRR